LADSAAVDTAVISALYADATLMGLLPDGVYFGTAPQSKTKCAIVTLPAHHDSDQFQGTAFEEFTYMVKALVRDNGVTTANQAAARIDVVMRTLPAPAGYLLTLSRRGEHIAYTEPDPVNPDQMWQHRGGLYELWVEPQ
jgi:hypothetical protein